MSRFGRYHRNIRRARLHSNSAFPVFKSFMPKIRPRVRAAACSKMLSAGNLTDSYLFIYLLTYPYILLLFFFLSVCYFLSQITPDKYSVSGKQEGNKATSVQFSVIYVALLTMGVVTKQLYRKLAVDINLSLTSKAEVLWWQRKIP